MSNKLNTQQRTIKKSSSGKNTMEAGLMITDDVTRYTINQPNQPPILSYSALKPENTMTAIEKMELFRTGISKQDLELLKEKTGLDYENLAKGLAVTKATLFSKKGKEKFSADLSERILSLADIYSYGYAVFEDVDRFNNWMLRPNGALGGKAPYAFVDNQFGREEIKDLIGRIEYGVFS